VAVKFEGTINAYESSRVDDKVLIRLQGTTWVTKGVFDWIGVVIWETSWRIYNRYGRLLWNDNRRHSIMPFTTTVDKGVDDIEAEIDYEPAGYIVQLIAGGKVLDEVTIIPEQRPVITPPPEPPEPEPEPPEPWPPIPTPEPPPEPIPEPTPTPTPTPTPDWTWALIGGIILLVLAAPSSRRRK
jgi:hypothetical protein